MRESRNKSVIEELGKEHLEKIIENTSCASDVLRSYNLCPNGSASRVALKRISKEWNVTLKFNQGYAREKRVCYSIKRSFEDVFKKDSLVAQPVLRRAVRRWEVLDLTKCSICGIINVWNEKPITMILDHINGVSNDNRIENIRMVCPNCNSQLETTGSRNKMGR